MARFRVLCRSLVALSAAALLLSGCGSSSGPSTDTADQSASPAAAPGPVVVATSTWEAALAEAAGARHVKSIVPASIKHAPDYELKPSDLIAIANADYVLYASFEPFAGKVKEAASAKAKLVEVTLDNGRTAASAEVTRLGKLFGTEQDAARWNRSFSERWEELQQELKASWPGGQPPVVVAQVFTTWAADLAGITPAGTYGREQVTPAQLSELSAKKPAFVLDNENMSTGTVLPDSGAKQLDIANYPGDDLDLLAVYTKAAEQLKNAFSGS
ncbi:TroA family protein [Peterkaempfera bronchialis]|uniref:ABC transporter substrate-binding protein n=1 Tax=Peterkaempfera bronchialis TaxID=2126346 RepID=A0A345SR71_9ACTN|nr:zinc ABC transporter substrate-binding protein [Peterkaempfera bronchialis]AXI76226.1 ABC transporter substrate-binding protein [Peterkaempfera bronchialis]